MSNQSKALLCAVAGIELDDHQPKLARLEANTSLDLNAAEALKTQVNERSLYRAQRQPGLSDSVLQRLLGQATGRSPTYFPVAVGAPALCR